MSRLKIEHSTSEGEGGATNAIVSVAGRIERTTAADLEEALAPYHDGTFSTVVLDLEGLEHINSTGIGALIRLSDILAERGTRLALAGVQSNILAILEMMSLDRYLQCYANCEEALAGSEPD